MEPPVASPFGNLCPGLGTLGGVQSLGCGEKGKWRILVREGVARLFLAPDMASFCAGPHAHHPPGHLPHFPAPPTLTTPPSTPSLEDIEGGHGGAADHKQRAFKLALAYTFLLRTLGPAPIHLRGRPPIARVFASVVLIVGVLGAFSVARARAGAR